MKKLLLIVAVLFLTVGTTFSQHKGKKYIGTSFMMPAQWISGAAYPGTYFTTGFNTSTVGDLKTTTFGIAPDFGFFVSDNIVVGLSAGYNHTNVKDGDRANSFGINPYMRYYFWMGDRLGFFLQPGISYVSSRVTGQGISNKIFYAGVRPGIDYKLAEKFDLVASFGNIGYTDYGKKKNSAGDFVRTSSFDISLNMASLDLALVYVF